MNQPELFGSKTIRVGLKNLIGGQKGSTGNRKTRTTWVDLRSGPQKHREYRTHVFLKLQEKSVGFNGRKKRVAPSIQGQERAKPGGRKLATNKKTKQQGEVHGRGDDRQELLGAGKKNRKKDVGV